MRIMLLQLPPWGIETLPLGLSYIAGALDSVKQDVCVYDMNIKLYHDLEDNLRKVWYSQDILFWTKIFVKNYSHLLNKYVNEILQEDFNVLGIATNVFGTEILRFILPRLRKERRDLKIIVGGGIGLKKETRQLVNEGQVDFFIVDEGETAINMLILSLEKKAIPISDEKFTVFKDSVSGPICIKANLKAKINDIPDPNYEKFPLSLYEDKHTLPISFSRGCIKQCAFCSDSPQLFPFRTRRPENVVEEMKKHVRLYNRKVFNVVDLVMNGSIPFLERFCDILIKEKIKVSWNGQATIRGEMTPELLMKMKFSGCTSISFGVESFSDKVLSLMRKGYTSGLAKKVIKDAKESGMTVSINLIVGFPGETVEDINQTIEAIKELSPYLDIINSMNLCTINVGAPLYTEPHTFGISNESIKSGGNWKLKDNSLDVHERLRRFDILYEVCKKYNLAPKWTNSSAIRFELQKK